MKYLKNILASVLAALMVINTTPAVRADLGADMKGSYTLELVVTEPFTAYEQVCYYVDGHPLAYYSGYREDVFTTREASSSPNFPGSQPNYRDNLVEQNYFDTPAKIGGVKALRYWDNYYSYPDYLHLQNQVTHRASDNLNCGTVYTATDNTWSANAIIHDTPLRTAHNLTALGLPNWNTGTTQTLNVDGRQYLRVSGTSGMLYSVTISLGTSVDAVTGLAYAPHFYRVHTVSNNIATGVTTSPFGDSTYHAVFNALGNVWYDITPSYVTPRTYWDFTYQMTTVSVTAK